MNDQKKSPKRLFFLIFGTTLKKQIGTGLIIFALAGLFYIYYPLIQLFLPQNTADLRAESRISIPKINVVSPIIWDVDPFNPKEYRDILTRGIAHAEGTAKPSQSGTVYLFAHSSDFPWRLTRYNVIFFRLDELKRGDRIILTSEGKDYEYQVREKKTVWPNEVEYLTKATRTQLILQTCIPPGTSFQRLLIFADPV